MRYIWWGVLVILIIGAIWKLFLPHGSKAYVEKSVTLDDALKQGRPLPEANLEGINPAERLKDGQKVVVPYKVQVQNEVMIQDPSKPSVNGSNPQGVASPNLSISTGRTTVSSNGKININTAGATELDKLSGVGPALAERIIQYRTEHGPFTIPEDLQNVSGIGPKTYDKMSSQVTVSP